MVVTPSGKFQEYSDFWEIPTRDELEDYQYCDENGGEI
jgi:hypothetical protein